MIKNKRKKIVSIVMSMAVLSSVINVRTYAQEVAVDGGEILQSIYEEWKNNSPGEPEVTKERLELEGKLNEIYGTIEEQMCTKAVSSVNSNSRLEEERVHYTDYYGGAYIDEDKLVVCISDENAVSEFGQKLSDEDLVEFKKVESSYNDLQNCLDDITNKYTEYYSRYKNTDTKEFNLVSSFAGMGIDQKENCVYVDVVSLDEEKQHTYDILFGKNNNVYLRNTDAFCKDAATFKPGRAIYVIKEESGNTRKVSRLSMGYRAYRQLQGSSNIAYGFASCAHGIKESIDKNVYMGTNCEKVLGTISVTKYSGSVDASFIKIAPGHSVGTTVKYADSSGGTSNPDIIAEYIYMTNVAQGKTIFKVGSTTYKTVGEVLDTNYSHTVNGVTFNNLTTTTAYVRGGDSGGIVYTSYDSKHIPCGLVKAYGTDYSVYTKADRALTTISIHPY